MDNLLILSHQRCGSTALMKFMGAVLDQPFGFEIFNKKKGGEQFPGWLGMNSWEIRDHFTKKADEFPIIKHIYGQRPVIFDELLASHPSFARFILLYRKDTYAAALSHLIAAKIKDYHHAPEQPLGAIAVADVRRHASTMRNKFNRMHRVCQQAMLGERIKLMSYEELYSTDEAERKAALLDLLKFAAPGGSFDIDSAYAEYMSPKGKINSEETYTLIENAEELARSFPRLFPSMKDGAKAEAAEG